MPGWLHNPVLVGLSLLCCFPIGLALTWTSPWTKRTKTVITAVVAAFVLLTIVSAAVSPKKATNVTTASPTTNASPAVSPSTAAPATSAPTTSTPATSAPPTTTTTTTEVTTTAPVTTATPTTAPAPPADALALGKALPGDLADASPWTDTTKYDKQRWTTVQGDAVQSAALASWNYKSPVVGAPDVERQGSANVWFFTNTAARDKAEAEEKAATPDLILRFVPCGPVLVMVSASPDAANTATNQVEGRAERVRGMLPSLLGGPC